MMQILILCCLFLVTDAVFCKNGLIRRAVATAGLSLGFGSLPVFATPGPAPWDSNVQYEVLQRAPADAPGIDKPGEMVAIKFTGSYKGQVFDDVQQPYFLRAGGGNVVKGLDDALTQMKIGDKWSLSFGGDLGFVNGKPSSPGKARIPPGGQLDFIVEIVDIPGKGDPDALILD